MKSPIYALDVHVHLITEVAGTLNDWRTHKHKHLPTAYAVQQVLWDEDERFYAALVSAAGAAGAAGFGGLQS
jgi:hypothetical protein